MNHKKIWLSLAQMGGNEQKYIQEAFDTNWVALLGSEFMGQKCGTFGKFGILSFNGNKIITTSGGGALICDSKEDADRVKFFSTQAREPDKPYYYHKHIGYNYRLSNVCAGIGRGQMEVLQEHVERRREIHAIYLDAFKDVPGISVKNITDDRYCPNYWLTTITVDKNKTGLSAEDIMHMLDQNNVESRLLWRPMHMQPVYANAPFYGDGISEQIFNTGLCLPSGSILSDNDIERVISLIKSSI